MAVIVLKAGRTAIRRSVQRQHHLFSPASNRQKSSVIERTPVEKGHGTGEEGKAILTPNTTISVPLWQRLGLLSKVFSAYGRAQRTKPYTTQFCTSLAIYFCGDLSAQKLGGDKYEPLRSARNMVIGGICAIPAYKWFLYLGRSFNYSSKVLSLAVKVVVNQIVFTPVFNSYFFGMQALLSGDSIISAWEHIKHTVPVSFVNACKLWPAVTAFNFTYIDPQYRALFAGFVAIGWQSYLSWLNQKAVVEALASRGVQNAPSQESTKQKDIPLGEADSRHSCHVHDLAIPTKAEATSY